jgi:hypothetical protein
MGKSVPNPKFMLGFHVHHAVARQHDFVAPNPAVRNGWAKPCFEKDLT